MAYTRHTGKREGGGVLVAILRTLQPLRITNIIGNHLHTHIEFLLIELPSRDRPKVSLSAQCTYHLTHQMTFIPHTWICSQRL